MPEYDVTSYRAADYDELAELRSWAERARAEHGCPLPRHLSVSVGVSLGLVERLLRAHDRHAQADGTTLTAEECSTLKRDVFASTPIGEVMAKIAEGARGARS